MFGVGPIEILVMLLMVAGAIALLFMLVRAARR